MGQVKELNIKNQTYYFFNDMTDIKNFQSNLLKIDKKPYKNGQVKELNIKIQTYYFFNDMVDIKNFQSNLLKTDKKPDKNFDIYYIGYIIIKKVGNYENIHSVNPLYLIFHSATGYFKEKYDEKYLILDSTEKYEEVFSGIK